MTWDEELESLFDLPMFEDVRLPAPKITADGRLEQSFMEIVAFYEVHNREPQLTASINEKLLARTLKSIRENPQKKKALIILPCCLKKLAKLKKNTKNATMHWLPTLKMTVYLNAKKNRFGFAATAAIL